MVKAIPMEDWLRGCVYHDGRHGEVILPTDKVLQIANYIQRTRRSGTDGLIDLEVVEADRKDENNSEIPNNSTISKMEQVDGECADCKWHDKEWWYIKCDGCSRLHSHFEPKDEPQTDCAWK